MFEPEELNQWFSAEQQKSYVSMLLGRVGLTRRRAECLVRLWAYLVIKQKLQSGELLKPPLQELTQPEGLIPCTHREMAALFYPDGDRGSERAAGMMLDRLVDLRLVKKQFDGNSICLEINNLANLLTPANKILEPAESKIEFKTDAFNSRTDAIPVATFLARNYNWMNNNTMSLPPRIAHWLRTWAQQYPTGMRVLRRSDNLNPVGFYVFYPIARESENYLFQSPAKCLHLTSVREVDLFQMARPGDLTCTALFIRSWMIDPPNNQKPQICQFLKDCQHTLRQMQVDFPNLCDLYALVIHPTYEELVKSLGFQTINQEPLGSIYLVYLAIDRFLALDLEAIFLKDSFHHP